MEYENTQRSPLGVLLFLVGISGFVSAGFSQGNTTLLLVGLGAGSAFVLLGSMFHQLTVRDDGDALEIFFGPLSLFRKRISYADISGAKRDTSSWIDGWGIHYLPGRGYIWNLWGFDCVSLTVSDKTFRIGSNDADRLTAFLLKRITPAS